MSRAQPTFSGSMVALVTPFREHAIDWDAFGPLIERQIAGGSSALVPCGSTGESATLTYEEHHRVVSFVVERAAGRVPVIAGTGSNATAEAIALTRAAKEAGAAGALLISPYYNRPTQEGLLRHYTTIADAVDLPLILYNIPGRTASRIEATTVAALAQHPNIVGLKEADDSLDHASDVLHLAGEAIELYSGDDAMTLPIVALGGVGVISTVANLIPREMAELTAAARAGNLDTARALHFRLLPLMRACFVESNPIPLKHALAALGLCRDELRLPLTTLRDTHHHDRLMGALRDAGLSRR